MKTSHLLNYLRVRAEGELIASFGEARLVRYLNGKFELRGGTETDRSEAKEWCSLFLHGAVFTSSSPRVHPRRLRQSHGHAAG